MLRLALTLLAAAVAAMPAAAQDVYVTRHYDTPAGQRDPDLLPAGQSRAAALSAWFGTRTLAAIYVSDFRRTRQTIAPLAARLGLTPIVYDPADTPALIARVRAETGPVLIVGHSNTVPDVVAALGGTRPRALVHEDFGDLWIVAPGGATEHHRVEAQ